MIETETETETGIEIEIEIGMGGGTGIGTGTETTSDGIGVIGVAREVIVGLVIERTGLKGTTETERIMDEAVRGQRVRLRSTAIFPARRIDGETGAGAGGVEAFECPEKNGRVLSRLIELAFNAKVRFNSFVSALNFRECIKLSSYSRH